MLRWEGKFGSMLGHSMKGENNEKRICSFSSGMSCRGSDGGTGLGADGQGFAAQSAGEGELRVGRRENNHGGLFEPARQGPQDFWRFGPLWGGLARGWQRSNHFRYNGCPDAPGQPRA